MTPLTVACVWVRGNVPYGVEYVTRLRSMVAAHLDRPHTFVCLTDRPWLVPEGIQTTPIPAVGELFGWWAKVRLFAPERFSGRVVYLDLDSLIVGDLSRVADYSSTFALVPPGGTFEGKDGLSVVKRFNSSVMVWDAGANAKLWTDWRPSVAARLWGDQDWIGEQMPAADTMPAVWFPRLSAIGAGPVPSEAIVVLAKKPKPAEAAKRWPWVREAWAA